MHALMAGSIYLKDHTDIVVNENLHIHNTYCQFATYYSGYNLNIIIIVQNAHRESNQVPSHSAVFGASV